MTPAEKIKFVNKHQSAEFFEKDAELFVKSYPASRLVREIESAKAFKGSAGVYVKKNLDGRMLIQILDVVCGDTILENRGVVVDNKKPGKDAPDPALLLNTFRRIDLKKTPYPDLKSWVKDLGIQPDNQKKATLLKALQKKQKELAGGDEVNTEAPDPVEEKKSEGQE